MKYRHKDSGKLCTAQPTLDSAFIHATDEDGNTSRHTTAEFAQEFDLVKPEPEAEHEPENFAPELESAS